MDKQKDTVRKTVNTSKKPFNRFMRYSSMGFEIIGAILLGWWVGKKIDTYFQNENQLATISLTMLMLFAAMFHVIKSLIKEVRN